MTRKNHGKVIKRRLAVNQPADKNKGIEVPCPFCALDKLGFHIEGAIVDLNIMRIHSDVVLTHEQGMNIIYICLNAKNNQALKVGEGLHSELCDVVHMQEGILEFGFHAGAGRCAC